MLTFAEHERAVASVAAALRDRYGVQPGDRVAILAANCPEWIVTFWATVSLGAIAVGLNGWWVGPEIRYGIEDSDPRVLVADRRRLDRLEGEDPGVPTIVIEDEFDRSCITIRVRRCRTCRSMRTTPRSFSTRAAPRAVRRVRSTRIATWSAALGLSFFHGARMAIANPAPPDAMPVSQLVTYPLFHVSGLHMATIAFMISGVRSVWLIGRFDPEKVMQLIETEQVTGWSYTATMLHRVVTTPRSAATT